jgi:Zn-dependent M28 family amino/carboxypeptidase
MKRALLVLAAAVGLTVAVLAALAARSDGDEAETVPRNAVPVTPEQAARAVTEEGLLRHLRELQTIADENGGTREVGSAGFDGSVDYVVRTLNAAGYTPTLHRFTVRVSREVRPPTLEVLAPRPLQPEGEYLALEYSGSGDVTAPVEAVDTESEGSGCEQSDFDGFSRGAIALLRRGACFFAVKVENAEEAGASAALVFNDGGSGREGPVSGTLGRPVEIPAVGISHALGTQLAEIERARVHLVVQIDNTALETTNVIADLPGRDDGGVVLLGAHLDSVAAGPGINDNGSGVAAVLETAVQLKRIGARPERGIRFGFWAAEELGLHGSRAYAESLDDPDSVAAVLNFDMVGSPNFVRLVYDGDGEIEEAFRAWFAERELPVEETALEGRSDHAPFAERGIPVGGIFTGADEPKTAMEEQLFGGEAGAARDPCYHQACDTIDNVNERILGQAADAAAAVALELAGA